MTKILVALGTRPEVIKLAPVIASLKERTEVVVCSSGQHREMLDQALRSFNIVPDLEIDAMSPGRSLNILASRLLEGFDALLEEHRPDWVVVQGDTTTAFCAALAAFHQGLRVAHVEAGLRTGNLQNPFPEEANRSLISRISDMHFAPTKRAAMALASEGVDTNAIRVTGNTLVDALLQKQASWTNGRPDVVPKLIEDIIFSGSPIVLVTCHRRENFGNVLSGICGALKRLCALYPQHQWIFPVHLNPGVREPVQRMLGQLRNFHLVEPVNYDTSLFLISKSSLVISDSGGIQEEAPTFGTPVVVMRSHTERMEGIDAGFACLAGQGSDEIERAVKLWLDNPDAKKELQNRANPYGDGFAAQRIASILCEEQTTDFHG